MHRQVQQDRREVRPTRHATGGIVRTKLGIVVDFRTDLLFNRTATLMGEVMRKRAFVTAFLAFALTGVVAHAQARSDVTLKVATYGGAFDQLQMKYAASLLTARTGIKVEMIDGNADDHLAKMIASRGREAPYDVVFLDDSVQAKAIAAGLLSKMTEKDVPNLRFVYSSVKSEQGFGPGMDLYSCGLAYNTQNIKAAGVAPPTSWADLWKPELAGHVGVPTLATTMGQCLLAAAEKLAGGDESTPEKGIAKLLDLRRILPRFLVHHYHPTDDRQRVGGSVAQRAHLEPS